MHEPEYTGLQSIISGGQCGTDRGALEAAHQHKVMTGGMAPKGWITVRGPAPILGTKFGLIEDTSAEYLPRTRKNVEGADGTLIVASNIASPGTRKTIQFCQKFGRFCQVVQLGDDFDSKLVSPVVVKWIIDHKIKILNVAGNRDIGISMVHHEATYRLMDWVLMDLYDQKLLQVQSDTIGA